MEQMLPPHPSMAATTAAAQLAYAAPSYPPAATTTAGSPAAAAAFRTSSLTYQAHQFHQQYQHQHQRQLQAFWASQMAEIEQTTDFKNHSLPLARIKKIMKADEDVRMIAAEAPVVFARACEMFILELTLRAWIHTEENKRRTLQKSDVAAAVARTDMFDFLVDIVPRDELKDEGFGLGLLRTEPTVPYYYVPTQQQQQVPAGLGMVMVGKPMDHFVWQQQQHLADSR